MGGAGAEIEGAQKATGMSRYVISPDARTDLNDIWEYIARDDVDVATRWVGKLREAVESLARSPGLGHSRKDLTDLPLLFWPVGDYLVIYRMIESRIEIVAVTHGARDIPTFLQSRF
jgi:plasmid stabilization system protein ParE